MTTLLARMSARRCAALVDKLDALAQDFDEWMALSKKDALLEKHHTQVRRLVRRLDRLRAALEEEIKALGSGRRGGGGTSLVDAHNLERDVLFLHNMWEFFRAKLAQRHVPWTKRFLDIADDYAWGCLQPVTRAAVEAGHIQAAKVKEPPLTYLNGDWSPFAATRGNAFMAEAINTSETEREAFHREVNALPLSVLGLPWYQLSHVPDLLILAHEVGHVVEDDLQLTDTLDELLARALTKGGVPDSRAEAWHEWLGEAFADTFGAAAGGRAFALTLLDFVALDVEEVREEVATADDWGIYPITALRADLMAEGLDVLGDSDGATEVRKRRDALLAGAETMPDFRSDAALIARAWLDTPLDAFGGKSLLSVARVGSTHWKDAERVSREARKSRFPLPSADPRVLVSASRIAFEDDPDAYRLREVPLEAITGDPQSLILAQFASTRKRGTRGPKPASLVDAEEAVEVADDAEAEAMLQRLRTTR